MVIKTEGRCISATILMILFGSFCLATVNAQPDTLNGKNLFNPDRFRDTLTIPVSDDELSPAFGDTLAWRLQFVRDSLMAREQFIRDSLMAREQFIMDSIRQRKRRVDSLVFLQRELPIVLDAYLKTVREEHIAHLYKINITGDSVLSDFGYLVLPFTLTQPFTPWKVSLSLSDKQVKIKADTTIRKITSVQAPFMKCTFTYGTHPAVMVIHELSTIQNDRSGQFYKTPFDSVFFDSRNRIIKIKRYIQFYSIVNTTQRGTPLFLNLSQVKQYEYAPDGRIKRCQVVSFCDRWKAYESARVCNIITWDISVSNNTYRLVRNNDPANTYSDGTFTFDFDENENLKGLSFQNLALTESWKRVVELNKDGNVNCYLDWKKDRVCQSLCMIYHTGEPGAKHPVETITTIYEEDGTSYHQKNNTTGLSRSRDKMTMEWGPWR